MMRPVHMVISTSGNSQPIPLDQYVNGYALGVAVTSGAVVNYTIQFCMDSPFANYSNSYAVSGTWLNSTDPVMVNQSASRSSNFAYPPAATRINVTKLSAATNAPAQITYNIIPMGIL